MHDWITAQEREHAASQKKLSECQGELQRTRQQVGRLAIPISADRQFLSEERPENTLAKVS